MKIPFIALQSLAPRRIFIPLEPCDVKGNSLTNDLGKYDEYGQLKKAYKEIIENEEKLHIYWNSSTWKKSAKVVRIGDRIPRELWIDSIDTENINGGSKAVGKNVDLAFGMGADDTFGLFITFNPLIKIEGSSQSAVLLIQKPSEALSLPLEYKDRPTIIIKLDFISISADIEANSTPKGVDFLSRIWGYKFWGFQLKSPLLVKTPKEEFNLADRYTLCVDFGSSSTTASLFPTNPDFYGSDCEFLAKGITSWSKTTFAPCYPGESTKQNFNFELDYDVFRHGDKKKIYKQFENMPRHVLNHRKVGKLEENSPVPSSLYAFEPKDAAIETVIEGLEVAIGMEAIEFHDDTNRPINYDCFIYSPKMIIGNEDQHDMDAFKKVSMRETEPAQLFLRSYFDQLYFSMSQDLIPSKPNYSIDTIASGLFR